MTLKKRFILILTVMLAAFGALFTACDDSDTEPAEGDGWWTGENGFDYAALYPYNQTFEGLACAYSVDEYYFMFGRDKIIINLFCGFRDLDEFVNEEVTVSVTAFNSDNQPIVLSEVQINCTYQTCGLEFVQNDKGYVTDIDYKYSQKVTLPEDLITEMKGSMRLDVSVVGESINDCATVGLNYMINDYNHIYNHFNFYREAYENGSVVHYVQLDPLQKNGYLENKLRRSPENAILSLI